MTKQDYDNKVLSLKGTHDYDMLCFIRGQYIESLEAEIAKLKEENEGEKPKTLSQIAVSIYEEYEHFYQSDGDIENQLEHLSEEIGELSEAIYGNKDCSWNDCELHNDGKIGYDSIKNTIQDELSDILIMTLALCKWAGMTLSMFDIEWHVAKKMEYNKNATITYLSRQRRRNECIYRPRKRTTRSKNSRANEGKPTPESYQCKQRKQDGA